jgi:membrane-associated phospholipid phosphatase
MNARFPTLVILRVSAIALALFSELSIGSASESLTLEQSEQATPATLSQAAYPRESLLAYGSRFDQPQGSLWELDEGHSFLVSTGSDSNGLTATGQSNTESLFSKDYWKLVGSDIKATFTAPARWDRKDWLIFGGVTAGVGLAFVFDEDIRSHIQRNRNSTVDSVFDSLEPFGQEYSAGVLLAFYVGGEFLHDPRAKSVALDGISASIIASGLIDQPLKYVIGRSRPSKDQGAYDFHPFNGSASFPSGHATQAFAVATVISEHYESLWIRLTAYGLASAVGYARLNKDEHWTSDVLAGAAIGTFVGHVVVHFNQHHRNISLQPVIERNMQGGQISFSF